MSSIETASNVSESESAQSKPKEFTIGGEVIAESRNEDLENSVEMKDLKPHEGAVIEDLVQVDLQEEAEIKDEVSHNEENRMGTKLKIMWISAIVLCPSLVSLVFGLIPVALPTTYISTWTATLLIYPFLGLLLGYTLYYTFLLQLPISQPFKANPFALVIIFSISFALTNLLAAFAGWFRMFGLAIFSVIVITSMALCYVFERGNVEGEPRKILNRNFVHYILSIAHLTVAGVLGAIYVYLFAMSGMTGQLILPFLYKGLTLFMSWTSTKIRTSRDDIGKTLLQRYIVLSVMDILQVFVFAGLKIPPYALISVWGSFLLTQLVVTFQYTNMYWFLKSKVLSFLMKFRTREASNFYQLSYKVETMLQFVLIMYSQAISMAYYMITSIALRYGFNKSIFPFYYVEDQLYFSTMIFVIVSLIYIILIVIIAIAWTLRFHNDMMKLFEKELSSIVRNRNLTFGVVGITLCIQAITTLMLMYHSQIWTYE